MCNELLLQSSDRDLYVPEKARVTHIEKHTPIEKVFELELLSGRCLNHHPGQFVQLSILGIGEAPISVCCPPRKDATFELGVRAVGEVTNKIHTLRVGDEVFVRGPFGHGFDADIQEKLMNRHLLFIAGGCGYFPIRSLINQVLGEEEQYQKISILYGCKTPKEQLYVRELEQIAEQGKKIELFETVDHPDERWKKHHGVITTLIPRVEIKDPSQVIPIIVGPPIMYKFVIKTLLELDVPKENIYVSLERRMECGVGKCGHCQMEGIYVCQEGPVFNYAEIEKNNEVL